MSRPQPTVTSTGQTGSDAAERAQTRARTRGTGLTTSVPSTWQRAIGPVLELPTREQLKAYSLLRDHLGEELGEESDRDRQARRRAEALAAMDEAAQHLGLGRGCAPSADEYRCAAKETELSVSFNQVRQAWGRWEVATRVFEGAVAPLTAAQQTAKRATLGARRLTEDYVRGLRLWLASEPALTRKEDYRMFAREYNERRREGELRLLEQANTMTRHLFVLWPDLLAVARGEMTLEEAAARRREALLPISGPLVGIELAGAMLDLRPHKVYPRAEGADFPPPVAVLGGNRVWLRADIEAYRDGKPVPARRRGELQSSLFDAEQLRVKLGLGVMPFMHRGRDKTGKYVPRPAGQAAGSRYWWRKDVEAWLAAAATKTLIK